MYLVSGSDHPDGHDQVFAVEGGKGLRQTEDRARPPFQRRSLDHIEVPHEALVGRGRLFDLQGEELAVRLQQGIDLPGVPVAVKIEVGRSPDILVAPILYEGMRERSVYLPAGRTWKEVQTGKVYEGGITVQCDAPLSVIPVFTTNGSEFRFVD